MAYATAQDVADLTPWLLGQGEDNFSRTSRPTEAAVERWLTRGAAKIDAGLRARGYGTPVGAGAIVYEQVVDVNALYGAYKAESTRMSSRIAVTERTRSQMFKSDFDKALKELLAMDLSQTGVAHTTQIKAGGISKSDKESEETNTDRVKPRFSRGQFDISDGGKPSGDYINPETS